MIIAAARSIRSQGRPSLQISTFSNPNRWSRALKAEAVKIAYNASVICTIKGMEIKWTRKKDQLIMILLESETLQYYV